MLAITTKSPYAVRALTELVQRGDGRPVPIGEIAKARAIPTQFLEGLFSTLRRARILKSQRGVKGGYMFARDPSKITVLEVVELLEGTLGESASDAGEIWVETVDAVKGVLGGVTIAELAEREAEGSSPMYYI